MKLHEILEEMNRRDFMKLGAAAIAAPAVAKAGGAFGDGYDQELESAAAALDQCCTQSTTLEYGGAVFSMDNKYFFTPPQTSDSDHGINDLRIRYPSRATLMGVYHTHPAGGSNDKFFSSEDVKYSIKNKMKLYLGIIATREIRIFIPGQTKVENHTQLGKISYGQVVGKF
jgi:hypothetical protein